MKFVSKLTPEQWAEAAKLRAEGASFSAIAARFGVHATSVGVHARKHNWPGHGTPARVAPLHKRSFVGASMGQRRRLVRRLYNAIDIRLSLMEKRMQQQLATLGTDNPQLPPPGENEREARAIGALIRNLDKVTEYAADLEATTSGGRTAAAAAALASEADAFRRDIAERLAKLVPAR